MYNLSKPALAVSLMLLMSGCASTASNSVAIDQPSTTSKDTMHYIAEETVDKNHKKSVTPTTAASANPLSCSSSRSAHSSVNYFPVLGPLFDLQTVPNVEHTLWWEVPVSMALPMFGPSIVGTLGSQVCVHSAE